MNINWSKIANVGIRVASVVVPQIGLIEQVAQALPELKGQQKEDAAVALSRALLETGEAVADKELVNDPQFNAAVRQFIRGYVALQNAVASRQNVPFQPSQSTSAILEHQQ